VGIAQLIYCTYAAQERMGADTLGAKRLDAIIRGGFWVAGKDKSWQNASVLQTNVLPSPAFVASLEEIWNSSTNALVWEEG
jgi:hypothetical protein